MTWTLFLDDERQPQEYLGEVRIARDCDEAVALIQAHGCPSVLSLDHDLGFQKLSGHQFVWWLIEQHLDGKLNVGSVKQVIIHSMNPVGATNTAGLWNGFASSIGLNVQAIISPAKQ